MKRKFEVTYYFTTTASFVVKAEDFDEAYSIADELVLEEQLKVKDNKLMHNLNEDESLTEITEL